MMRDRHREPGNLVTVHEGPNRLFHRGEFRFRWRRLWFVGECQ
jgi:hypothetical protein